jgi:hypothetical protein
LRELAPRLERLAERNISGRQKCVSGNDAREPDGVFGSETKTDQPTPVLAEQIDTGQI